MLQKLKISTIQMAALAFVAFLVLGSFPAGAEPTITWIGPNYPSDINADGSVVVGNTGDGLYETFRWTDEVGVVRLGMSSVAVFGSGGGSPDVSEDGNHVSATVVNADSTYITQGIWTKGEGWAWSMPPIPPDGGELDDSLGSTWGLSGDGTTLTGFYWRPGQPGGSAHINTWSEEEGHVALGSPLRNCRGNDLSYDASVAVGWSERTDGVWCPTVWENGGWTVLHNGGWFTQAEGVSNDGNTIWGNAFNPDSGHVEAAIWIRDGDGWQELTLGVLPGTFAGDGQAMCWDMTESGDTIVGYNAFYQNVGTGFVWTLEEGMVSAEAFMEAEGFVLPAGYTVGTLSGISNNGVVLTGFCWDTTSFPYDVHGFIATRENVSAVHENTVPRSVSLQGNYPNPFNPSTTIALALDKDQQVKLEVYDAAGRLVKELHNGILTQGRHDITWNGRDSRGLQAASGMYFARVSNHSGLSQSHRMMLVK